MKYKRVLDNSGTGFNIGDIVTLIKHASLGVLWQNADGLLQFIDLWQLGPAITLNKNIKIL